MRAHRPLYQESVLGVSHGVARTSYVSRLTVDISGAMVWFLAV